MTISYCSPSAIRAGAPLFAQRRAQRLSMRRVVDARRSYHPQIDEVTALAQAFPDTRICLNHVGGPLAIGSYAGKREEVLSRWSASIRALAKCPNVVVKLGGMAMRINGFDFHEKADPPSSAPQPIIINISSVEDCMPS